MRIARRDVLRLAAGAMAWPLTPAAGHASAPDKLYLSARADPGGGFRVSAFSAQGRKVLDQPLPARGHAFALHPGARTAVHFARRPGRFARVLRLHAGTAAQDFAPPDNRRFNGHGVFSGDGRLLYASENDFDAARGAIGIYDACDGWRRVGELPSHGTGPHDIRLHPDGNTLVVANGGIHTHPDMPRMKLNVPTMQPSLVYLDRRDGRLIARHELDAAYHQLSIRHLALGRDGAVAVAMQYVGPAGERMPLVGIQTGWRGIRLLDTPGHVLRDMKQYTGSAAFDSAGRVLAVSAPRGNLYAFWDAPSGELLSTVSIPDGSGIAPAGARARFLASSGRGGACLVDGRSGVFEPLRSPFLEAGRWDNHLLAINA